MASDERWLRSAWPFVAASLPPAPARVVELGCGPLGGFVPALREAGYDAVGVDPEAPAGDVFHQMPFEEYDAPDIVHAAVASLSLHHVADLAGVLDRVAAILRPGGSIVVLEWAWERLDERTVRWCFDRLPPGGAGDAAENWLQRRRDEWMAAGTPWETYLQAWAAEHGMHAGEAVLRGLEARFRRTALDTGPYFFVDLDGVTEADEMAAIEAGEITASLIRFAGTAEPDSAGTR